MSIAHGVQAPERNDRASHGVRASTRARAAEHDEAPAGLPHAKRSAADLRMAASELRALLAEQFRKRGAVQGAVAASGIPKRSLKRRFKAATGVALIDYCSTCVEDSKRLLEIS